MRGKLCSIICLSLICLLLFGCAGTSSGETLSATETKSAASMPDPLMPTPPNFYPTTDGTDLQPAESLTTEEKHLAILLEQDTDAIVYASYVEDINEDGIQDSIILYYDSSYSENTTSAGVSVFIGGYSCSAIGLGETNELVFSSEPVFCCHHGIATVFVFCKNQNNSDANPIYFQIDYTYDSVNRGSNFRITTTP